MPRHTPDLDFKIHVDESCISTPMEDDAMATDAAVGGDPMQQAEESESLVVTDNITEALADDPSDLNEPNDTVDEAAEEDVEEAAVSNHQPTELDQEASNEGDPAADETFDNDKEESEEAIPALNEDPLPDIEDSTPRPSQIIDAYMDESPSASRPESAASDRKTSLRTEALIQAAARAVVARIEEQARENVHQRRSAAASDAGVDPADDSMALVRTTGEESRPLSPSTTGRNSLDSAYLLPAPPSGSDTGGDVDDDVFSDRSPRSSLGSSAGDAASATGSTIHAKDDGEASYTRSPRVSGISNLSAYEMEEARFVPSTRGTPRPPFRTPSAVRALQMSSPAPSVSGSPRSSKRLHGGFSRVGSPVSTQYSPKNGRTPPRFKRREPAPLVLLHVTLLPLRCAWSDVFNSLEGLSKNDGYEPSEAMQRLHAAWRQLQDRVGDTVLERGVLLPHPQGDYEVLEERLLDALELPVRTRARILQCGHYLGPSNEQDSEDDDMSLAGDDEEQSRHWCTTCRSEIKLEPLGAGPNAFRVKIYASNGLMKAGAWAACWREMERIDAEVEPVVDSTLRYELEQAASRLHAAGREYHTDASPLMPESSPPNMQTSPASPLSPTPHLAPTTADRAARLREIYGRTPPPQTSPPHGEHGTHHPDSYIPPPSPPSPSAEAFERQTARRRSLQAAGLPELLWECARVVMREPKNVVIAALSLFVVMLAVRTAPPENPGAGGVLRPDQVGYPKIPEVPTLEEPVVVGAFPVADSATQAGEVVIKESAGLPAEAPLVVSDSQADSSEPAAASEKKILKVYETITETVQVTATHAVVKEEPETVVETVRVTVTEGNVPAAVESKAVDTA
jgi:hypothetical protein